MRKKTSYRAVAIETLTSTPVMTITDALETNGAPTITSA